MAWSVSERTKETASDQTIKGELKAGRNVCLDHHWLFAGEARVYIDHISFPAPSGESDERPPSDLFYCEFPCFDLLKTEQQVRAERDSEHSLFWSKELRLRRLCVIGTKVQLALVHSLLAQGTVGKVAVCNQVGRYPGFKLDIGLFGGGSARRV